MQNIVLEVIKTGLAVFGGMMAALPFFFYFLKLVMKNAINEERQVLNGMFVSKVEFDVKQEALKEDIRKVMIVSEKSLASSEKNALMLTSLLARKEL